MKTSAIVIAGSLALAACGESDKTVMQSDDGTVTVSEDGTTEIVGEDGAVATVTGGTTATSDAAKTALAALPPYAPPFPGSEVISTMNMDDGAGGVGTVLVQQTSAPFADVVRFYDKAIADSGAKAQMRVDQAGSAMRGVETKGEMSTLIAISDSGESRSISITTGKKG